MNKLFEFLKTLWGQPTTKAALGGALVAAGSLVMHDGNWDAQVFPVTGVPTTKEVAWGILLMLIVKQTNLGEVLSLLKAKKPGPILPPDTPK